MNILLGITDFKDILFAQAVLLLENKGIDISQIHYICTKKYDKIDSTIAGFYKNKNIDVFISSSSSSGKIKNERDYEALEEEVFKWYLKIISGKDNNIYAFIGGGHKYHSLALQRAAFLFGARDIFHMFYDGERGQEPKDINEVLEAIKNKKLLYASFGEETGWPALKYLNSNSDNIRKDILSITGAIASRSIKHVNEYPFECINLLPAKAIEWLEAPLTKKDKEWILNLPKTELHCHLGGFATHGEGLDSVRKAASGKIPDKKSIPYPDNWPLPDKTIDLKNYMNLGDNNGSYILKDEGCLVRQCELLYDHFTDQNIRYAEVRCSPFNYASDDMTGIEVLNVIRDTFNNKMSEAKQSNIRWCHVNLIIIATRKPNEDKISIIKHIGLATAAAEQSKTRGRCKVVGVDLAGYEHKETRASYFEQDFEPIHRAGVAITIHAGENDEAEGIWQAVFKLNTRRIGHGLRLYQSKELQRSVVDRKIGVEMCPYANYQIVGFSPMKNHETEYPLLKYLNAGVQACINTDNIGISKASLTDNFMLLPKLLPDITRMQVLRLIRNGLEQSFIDNSFRNALIRIFNEDIFKLIFYHKQ